MAFSFGVLSRQEAIGAMEAAPPWSNFELIKPRVVELSPDSGIVVYRVNAQRAGEEPYEAIISSTLCEVTGGGCWRFINSRPSQIKAEKSVPGHF
jgi:hypothetical protein